MPSVALFKISLDILYYSGASAALENVFGGSGAIFMLHHVLPGGGLSRGFAPNRGLEVTPEFLDQVLAMLKDRGFDLVNLDEAVNRIGTKGKRFAAFTLDDGYRDNLVHALPVFQRHQCPFTVYVAPAITDGTCELWWKGLEQVISHNDMVLGAIEGEALALPTRSLSEKYAAWKKLYWPVRKLEQYEQRRWIREFCGYNEVDIGEICRNAAMNWKELSKLAADPLCTVGAHTIGHFNVKALPETAALAEMTGSADRIEKELGTRPQHFAYPYGDHTSAGPREFALARKAGFKSAVTTRKGMLFADHMEHKYALPRLSLSGEYQNLRHVRTLIGGLPFALLNGFKTLNVS